MRGNRLYYFYSKRDNMTTVVPLVAWAFTREYDKRIVIWINKALPVLLDALKELTPEDTGEMLRSYKVENAKFEWQDIVWVISNDAGYAIYVEYWVNWLSYTYHKPKWTPFYKWSQSSKYGGVWNRTFARAVDNTRDRITKIIYNEIDR